MKISWSLLSLIPVSVSSLSLVASCSEIENFGKLVLNNLVKSIDNFYLKINELEQKYVNLKPSEVFIKLFSDLPTPVENYGYQNLVTKIWPDDENGVLKVDIKNSFSGQNERITSLSFNLKSNEQAKIDTEIKPLDYFNVDSSWLMTKIIKIKDGQKNLDPTDVANKILSAPDRVSELAKYINISEGQNNEEKILKKPLTNNESLVISDVQPIKHLGIIDQIFLKLHIVKSGQKSSPLLLTINGFEGTNIQGLKSKLTEEFLKKYAQDFFNSTDTPLRNNDNQTLDIFASQINSKTDLLKLFKNQTGIIEYPNWFNLPGVNLKISLLDLVNDSAMDEYGSLKAVFKFELRIDSNPPIILDNEEIKLYGFKIQSYRRFLWI